jgi:hypothetical protein
MAPTNDPDTDAERSRPPAVILIAASNDRERSAVARHLRRRFGEDYDIHVEATMASGLERLKGLRDDGRDLAIILVDFELTGGNAVELLSQAQTSHPSAIRALMVSRGGTYGTEPVLANE